MWQELEQHVIGWGAFPLSIGRTLARGADFIRIWQGRLTSESAYSRK